MSQIANTDCLSMIAMPFDGRLYTLLALLLFVTPFLRQNEIMVDL
jgi:hypothetical protein